jgi:hypothetical protein
MAVTCPAVAEYRNLIATDDGNTVYFEAPNGPTSSGWYVIRLRTDGLTTEPLKQRVADVSGSNLVSA